MFMSTGVTPNAAAMVGSAVAITVASRFSIKKVTATTRAIRRVCVLRPVSAVDEVTGISPCWMRDGCLASVSAVPYLKL